MEGRRRNEDRAAAQARSRLVARSLVLVPLRRPCLLHALLRLLQRREALVRGPEVLLRLRRAPHLRSNRHSGARAAAHRRSAARTRHWVGAGGRGWVRMGARATSSSSLRSCSRSCVRSFASMAFFCSSFSLRSACSTSSSSCAEGENEGGFFLTSGPTLHTHSEQGRPHTSQGAAAVPARAGEAAEASGEERWESARPLDRRLVALDGRLEQLDGVLNVGDVVAELCRVRAARAKQSAREERG